MQQDVLVGDVETLSRRFSRLDPTHTAEMLVALRPFAEMLDAMAPLLEELHSVARKLDTKTVAHDRPLKVSQVAEFTGKSHNLVRAWIKRGHLKAHRLSQSREWCVMYNDLQAFLRGERPPLSVIEGGKVAQ